MSSLPTGPMPRLSASAVLAALLLGITLPALGQSKQGSRNVSLVAHVPLGGSGEVGPVLFDQGGVVVYVAVGQDVYRIDTETGARTEITSFDARVMDLADLGPNRLGVSTESSVEIYNLETRSALRASELPGRAIFGYRHSNGDKLLVGASSEGAHLIEVESTYSAGWPVPEGIPGREDGFFGVYAAFDLATETDRLYAAGAGGYFVFDITDPAAVELLTHVNSAAIQRGIGIQATPDATHIVTTTNYASAPIRLFDLRPALDGAISQVRTAAGAWTADWRSHAERFEVRWPYVFVAARDQGFHMFNMRNAFEPYTTAWFTTSHDSDRGAVDIDVRNRDGLIAVTDSQTGLWLLRVDDFTGWDGRGWGEPNVSSVQDWTGGPTNSDRW